MTNAKLSGEIRAAADGLQSLPTFKKLWNSWAVHAQRLETFIQTLEGEQEQLKAQLEQAGVGPLAVRVEKLEQAMDKARQLCSIASDWNLDEVEIDGQMVRTLVLQEEFATL